MSCIKVNRRVAQGSLNHVPQGYSIGTDGCSLCVGMIVRMDEGSFWCAHFDCSPQGHPDELANIQAATFSMLASTLSGVPVSVDACTATQFNQSTGAIWAGIQQYFDGAKNGSSKAAHINTVANGIWISAHGVIRYLSASDHLTGHPAKSNNKATVPPPYLGFDTDTVLHQQTVQELVSNNYVFCLRYLSLGHLAQAGDLSASEAQVIRQNGLALMPVQHVSDQGWWPTEALGARYGQNAVTHAVAVGIPPSVTVWLDLEEVNSDAQPHNVIAYCTAWYHAVAEAKYSPGIYIGANCGLTGEQLYQLPFQAYWKSMSDVPEIPVRGYQMVQSRKINLCDIWIDPNHATADAKGGRPQWWAAQPS